MTLPIRPFVGDVGTDIIIDLQEDISSATDYKIFYKKPSGAVGSWIKDNLTIINSTMLRYTTLSDEDLDESGEWIFNPWVVLSGGEWTGKTVTQYVYARYEED